MKLKTLKLTTLLAGIVGAGLMYLLYATGIDEKGLLTRESVSNNLYRGLLKLTQEGMEAADFVCRRVKVAVDLASAGLDEARRQHLYDSLELISGNLRRISTEGLPESVDTENTPV